MHAVRARTKLHRMSGSPRLTVRAPLSGDRVKLLTLGFVVGLALGLTANAFLLGTLLPAPLSYTNVPFPVLPSRAHADGAYRPGETLRVVVARCYDEWLLHGELGAYTVDRTLVREDGPERYLMGTVAASQAEGCTPASESTLHTLPATDLTPGRYHVDGRAFASGRWTVTFTTQPFEVSTGT